MICIENWEFINYSKLCRCGGFLWITGLPNKKFTNPWLKRLEALYLILLFNSDKNLLNVHNASNTEALFFFTKMNKTKQSLSVEIKGNLLIIICTSKREGKSQCPRLIIMGLLPCLLNLYGFFYCTFMFLFRGPG